MIRFWFEFDLVNCSDPPSGVRLGCGVTSTSKDKAIETIQKKVFKQLSIPPILKCIENVDISQLDRNHVLHNMHPPITNGIWFPLGYE